MHIDSAVPMYYLAGINVDYINILFFDVPFF